MGTRAMFGGPESVPAIPCSKCRWRYPKAASHGRDSEAGSRTAILPRVASSDLLGTTRLTDHAHIVGGNPVERICRGLFASNQDKSYL